jgi:uncharacterized protein (TIGR02270 family)
VQRNDPGATLDRLLESPSGGVRARSLRTAGELGRGDVLPQLRHALVDLKHEVCFRAAEAAVLLGDRLAGLRTLSSCALEPARHHLRASRLSLQAMDCKSGHEQLLQLSDRTDGVRLRIMGTGYVGDPKYAPWLIDQMTNPAVARIAGEAFVHITGADFNLDQLEAMPPDDFEDGPSDDPDDENVELPEDIALPWPDLERIKAWWMEHRAEFTPGQKLFLGKPITPEHCIHVLKTGYQRQRVIAAHYRSLIQPGTVLFPTSAPAWRQHKLLQAL